MSTITAQQTAREETAKIPLLKKVSFILDAKQKRQVLLLGVMILIGGIFETIGVSLLVPIGNTIMDPQSIMASIDRRPHLADLLRNIGLYEPRRLTMALLGAMIVVFIVKNLYLLFLINKQNHFIAHARTDMITRVLKEFLNRPYEEYLGADIPTVFRITDTDIPQSFQLILALLQMATEIVVTVFLGAVLLTINWQMTAFILAILIVMTLINNKLLKPRLNKVGAHNQNIQSRIAKWRIEAIYGLKDVKVLNRQEFFIRNYYESGKIGADIITNYNVLNNLPRLMIETVFMVSVLGYVLIFMLTGGDVSKLIPQFMAFAVAAVRIMPSVNRINTYMTQVAYQEPSLNYLYDNLSDSVRTNKLEQEEKAKIAGPALHLNDKIELRHITYRYPDGERNILTDTGMVVPKGKSVGIMGPSGAGKSTLVDILLGLLHAQSGEILCDGRNIYSNYDSWLAQIGYIPQTIYLVDESIRDNIAFGIDADKISEKRVWEVLKEAQLDEFVKTLPEGLETKIGERGVRLSGGQRQRIGIARALYYDPEILVFDEATSALDNDTEKALMDAINSFHGRKTMIIIAHRLNTIENCDYIYKVDEEKITPTHLDKTQILHEEAQ